MRQIPIGKYHDLDHIHFECYIKDGTLDSRQTLSSFVELQNILESGRYMISDNHWWGYNTEDFPCSIDFGLVVGVFRNGGSTRADIQHLGDPSALINPIGHQYLQVLKEN